MTKLSAYRHSLPYSYAQGIFPSMALLAAKSGCARRLLLHSSTIDSQSEGIGALREKCRAMGVRIEIADHALLRISRKENCYAAIVFDKYESRLDPGLRHVVLHNPSDMGNLGTVFRTCLGFGFYDIAIIQPAADFYDPRVVRSSMGALFSLRIQSFEDMDSYRAAFAKHALFMFMLDGAARLVDVKGSMEPPYSLVFGNEGAGLPPQFAQLGKAVRIPHSSEIDSLNLAVAVSIAAYECSS